MLLCLHRLSEDGLAAAVLLLHGARRFLHVAEHSRLHRSGVGDYFRHCRIHFQQRAATRTGDFNRSWSLRHSAHDTAKADETGQVPMADGQRLSLMGKMWNMPNSSQPSRKIESRTMSTAISSPKVKPRRLGSKRLAARLRIFSVANPKTTAQRML